MKELAIHALTASQSYRDKSIPDSRGPRLQSQISDLVSILPGYLHKSLLHLWACLAVKHGKWCVKTGFSSDSGLHRKFMQVRVSTSSMCRPCLVDPGVLRSYRFKNNFNTSQLTSSIIKQASTWIPAGMLQEWNTSTCRGRATIGTSKTCTQCGRHATPSPRFIT